MPWPEYLRRVADGELADPGKGFIMPAFEATHPEHPMAGAQRFPRISAPGMPGRSAMVRRFARAALGRCATRGQVHFPVDRPLLLCLAEDIELAAGLGDLAEEHGLQLHQSHTAIDLVALASAVQVVDLNVCRAEDWEAFRAYLEACQADAPCIPAEPATPDKTPLLLLNCRETGDRMDVGLAKPKGTILRFGVGCRDMVLEAIRSALASRSGTGMGPITGETVRLALESLQQ